MKSIFEVIMLLCFGFSWPINLYKSIKSRTAKGKSVLFSILIVIGYASGMLHKAINNMDFVFYLYLLNFILVSADIVLYFRNVRLDRLRDAEAGVVSQPTTKRAG